MASGPIMSWQIDREIMETVTDFILGCSKITVSGDCSHGIRRQLLLGRKAMNNLAATAAKSLQLCPTPCDPRDSSPPGSPSLGFCRQKHWSGLPFPSPMHESEKWKWSRSVMSDSQWPHGLQPTRLLRSWDFPGKSTGVGCHFLIYPMKTNIPIISLMYFIGMESYWIMIPNQTQRQICCLEIIR